MVLQDMRRLTITVATLALGLAATGCIGETSEHATITPAELMNRLNGEHPPVVLDVRSPDEYRVGHVPGAINIPHRQIGARLDELTEAKQRGLVVYCEGGPRTEYAESVLRQAGFEQLYHLEGDMGAWRMNRLPVETR
jgi:rhodanese-related sulfurtransferase